MTEGVQRASTGKVVLITGGAGGFGRELTRRFAEDGAMVAAMDVTAEGIASLNEEMRSLGNAGGFLPLLCDVTNPASCRGAVSRALREFGHIDALINNAGVGMGLVRADHMDKAVATAEVDFEQWQTFMGVNASGPFNMIKAVLPHFEAQQSGRIVNVTTSFFTMQRGGFLPYAASKAALEAASASWAEEFAGTGITVNVVVPGGPADTPMVPEEAGFDRSKLIKPEAMFWPMRWLISGDGTAITGQRYIAANWDADLAPAAAAEACGMPIAWPDLKGTVVWPDDLK